jgi:hypothetical protein
MKREERRKSAAAAPVVHWERIIAGERGQISTVAEKLFGKEDS